MTKNDGELRRAKEGTSSLSLRPKFVTACHAFVFQRTPVPGVWHRLGIIGYNSWYSKKRDDDTNLVLLPHSFFNSCLQNPNSNHKFPVIGC